MGSETMSKCELCNNKLDHNFFYWHGDIEEDYDMDIYDCLCDTCFNNLNKQNKIKWKVKNEEEDLEKALDYKINKWGFETKNN